MIGVLNGTTAVTMKHFTHHVFQDENQATLRAFQKNTGHFSGKSTQHCKPTADN